MIVFLDNVYIRSNSIQGALRGPLAIHQPFPVHYVVDTSVPVQKIGARPEDIMHEDPMNLKFYVALCSHRTIQELLHLLLTVTQHSPQSLWKKCMLFY